MEFSSTRVPEAPTGRRCVQNLYTMSLECQRGSGDQGCGSRSRSSAPGSEDLAAVAERLGPFGVQILQGVCEQIPSSTSEDVVINVTRPIDLPLIEHALRPIGRKIVGLQPMA